MFSLERGQTRRGDWVLLGILVLLAGLGISAMLSASYYRSDITFGAPLYLFKWQAIILGLSLIPALVFAVLSPERLRMLVPFFLLSAAILMGLTFVPGIGHSIQGARRWIALFGFTFQPSEYVKLVLIIYLAHIFSKKQERVTDFINTVLPPLIVVIGFTGLVYLQNDFSTAFFVLFLSLSIFFIAGIPLLYFFLLGGVSIPMLLVMLLSKEHRVMRIISFLNPESDPVGSGYQMRIAREALMDGGLWGSGLGQSVHKLGGLPEPHSDFVFAVLGEEVGFIGVLAVICVFIAFAVRGYQISIESDDKFAKYIAFGVTTAILYQALFNMAVVSGLVPATGIPLPFFSQGGSSLIVTICMCGLLFNCSRKGWEARV